MLEWLTLLQDHCEQKDRQTQSCDPSELLMAKPPLLTPTINPYGFKPVESPVSRESCLECVRKSGDLFLNFLDLRGVTVARNLKTRRMVWVARMAMTGLIPHFTWPCKTCDVE